MRHVAVDIVTGFLGSGKTTLLQHVLAHGLAGTPVAVVVNEIGDVGVDGRMITGLGYVESMVELASGCICCSIDEYRFDLAIQEIVETVKPHVIVIESSGLADPEALAYRVKTAGLNLDAIITVVDAAAIERFLDEAVVASTQVAAADFLVVNKTDLVDHAALARVEARLRRLNDRALAFRSVRGALDADLLFATGVARARSATGGAHDHLARDGYVAWSWRSEAALDPAAFEAVVTRLPREIVRAKGLVRIAERTWHRLFNVTCGRADLGWLQLPDGAASQGVFIGREPERWRDALAAALADCAPGASCDAPSRARRR